MQRVLAVLGYGNLDKIKGVLMFADVIPGRRLSPQKSKQSIRPLCLLGVFSRLCHGTANRVVKSASSSFQLWFRMLAPVLRGRKHNRKPRNDHEHTKTAECGIIVAQALHKQDNARNYPAQYKRKLHAYLPVVSVPNVLAGRPKFLSAKAILSVLSKSEREFPANGYEEYNVVYHLIISN